MVTALYWNKTKSFWMCLLNWWTPSKKKSGEIMTGFLLNSCKNLISFLQESWLNLLVPRMISVRILYDLWWIWHDSSWILIWSIKNLAWSIDNLAWSKENLAWSAEYLAWSAESLAWPTEKFYMLYRATFIIYKISYVINVNITVSYYFVARLFSSYSICKWCSIK